MPLVLPQTQSTSSPFQSLPVNKNNNNNNFANNNNNSEPVCRVYLNRLSGFDCLCRVRYRIVLGHKPIESTSSNINSCSTTAQSAEFVDSKVLDQISDAGGRIRGYQFRNTNILRLISPKQTSTSKTTTPTPNSSSILTSTAINASLTNRNVPNRSSSRSGSSNGALDLRVRIELYCANTISEAKAQLSRKQNINAEQQQQKSNCCDRNKQVSQSFYLF